jgi:hypothetical protein
MINEPPRHVVQSLERTLVRATPRTNAESRASPSPSPPSSHGSNDPYYDVATCLGHSAQFIPDERERETVDRPSGLARAETFASLGRRAGIAITLPCWSSQRSATWPAFLLYRSPMLRSVGSRNTRLKASGEIGGQRHAVLMQDFQHHLLAEVRRVLHLIDQQRFPEPAGALFASVPP